MRQGPRPWDGRKTSLPRMGSSDSLGLAGSSKDCVAGKTLVSSVVNREPIAGYTRAFKREFIKSLSAYYLFEKGCKYPNLLLFPGPGKMPNISVILKDCSSCHPKTSRGMSCSSLFQSPREAKEPRPGVCEPAPRWLLGWGGAAAGAAAVTSCFVLATKAQIKAKLETFFGQLD